MLAESKIVFSANLQETLGISAMEAILVDSFPLLPNRLSYTEMYEPNFLYKSEWTESFDAYKANKEGLMRTIRNIISTYDDDSDELSGLFSIQRETLMNKYLNANVMIDNILGLE